jgi:hypothetical protein
MSVGGCEDGGLVAQGAAVGAHEEHLGADLEAAVDYIIKADASGRVVDFNLAAYSMTSRSSARPQGIAAGRCW